MSKNIKSSILLFTDWFLPGFKAGGPIVSCLNFANALQDYYTINIITSNSDSGDYTPYPEIIPNTWMDFNENIRIIYLDKSGESIQNIYNIILNINPDFLYLNSFFSKTYTIYPLLIFKLFPFKTKIILAPRGMLHKGALKYKKIKKVVFIKFFNFLNIFKSVHFQATDVEERNDIIRHLHILQGQVHTVSNFPTAFQPAYSPVEKEVGILNIIYISRISPKKNLLFLLELLATFESVECIKLTICGAIEDISYWEKCQQIIEKYPPKITTNFLGPVKHEEVIPLLLSHHIFCLPTYGENFGHAIFESFIAGRPALISDQTPWRNLEFKHAGWDLSLDDSEIWKAKLNQIALMNQSDYNLFSIGAWQLAANFLNENSLIEDYRKLFSLN